MAEVGKVKLGYWRTRGLAQQIRLLLEYTNTPYEDIRYEQGEAPICDRSYWMSIKFTLGLDFPNLPYYMDGDYKLTQSDAIMRYIADKNGMVGKNAEERGFISMIENVLYDWHTDYWAVTYDKNYADLIPDYLTKMESKYVEPILKLLSKSSWLVGDELTYVDFIFYELIDSNFLLIPSLREKYPTLVAYADKFEQLPAIKAYMSSPRFLRYPLNSPYAGWGVKDGPP